MHARLVALRLVAITDGAIGAAEAGALGRRCPAGGLLVQVRAKALEGAALAELTRQVIAAVRPYGQLVLVNDRLDVALATGADGVHLPERGLPIEVARAIVAARAGTIIGCSRHGAEAAARAVSEGADLVHLGPIWATPSKAGMGEPVGEAALRSARQAIGERGCLVAVGGIDAAHAGAARAAGAHAVAAIRAAWSGGELLL
jgi:thiamine-phosphate pyrophosphorylase